MNTQTPNGTASAYLAAIAYALIIGFSFMFVKLAIQVANPLDLLAHRFSLSFLVLTVPVLTGWLPFRIQRQDLLRLLPLGLFSPVLFFTFQTFGLVTTSSSEAGIIQATVPVFTLIMATIFLKERTTLLQKLSLLLSVGGGCLHLCHEGGRTALHSQHHRYYSHYALSHLLRCLWCISPAPDPEIRTT